MPTATWLARRWSGHLVTSYQGSRGPSPSRPYEERSHIGSPLSRLMWCRWARLHSPHAGRQLITVAGSVRFGAGQGRRWTHDGCIPAISPAIPTGEGGATDVELIRHGPASWTRR